MNFIERLEELDKNLFIFLNSHHTPAWDEIMYWVSHRFFWVPLYALLLFLIVKKGKKIAVVIVAVVIMAFFTDKGTVHLFKNVFERYRPCHNEDLKHFIHVAENCGGLYGFVSSHAANTFALALFLTLLLRDKIRYFGWFIFPWAALISYSRIYLGRHYPADIIVGALFGMVMALLTWYFFKYINKRLNDRFSFQTKS